MSVKYAIFLTGTGEIIRLITCNPELVALQKRPGEEALIVSEETSNATHYVDLETLTLRKFPTQPSPIHTFNYSTHQWYDPRNLTQLQDAKWEEIKAQREIQLFSPLTALGYTFDADQKGQDNIKGACQIAQFAIIAQQPFSTTFTLADNSRQAFTAEEMIQVGLALGLRTEQTHAHAATLREDIYNVTQPSQLESIVW